MMILPQTILDLLSLIIPMSTRSQSSVNWANGTKDKKNIFSHYFTVTMSESNNQTEFQPL
jgi:hypothetical protein